eukprot:1147472-Rhodomonas_salina.1
MEQEATRSSTARTQQYTPAQYKLCWLVPRICTAILGLAVLAVFVLGGAIVRGVLYWAEGQYHRRRRT